MGRIGFGSRWLSWIKWCISTASFSVLINGSPTGFFPSSKGLRQGDPLSPYLFAIGMEALSCLINRAVEGNYLSRSRIEDGRGGDLVISHLLYADDTLIFCEANKDQLKYLSWILMWFEALSGLKINLNKSEIIPIGPMDNVTPQTRGSVDYPSTRGIQVDVELPNATSENRAESPLYGELYPNKTPA